MSIGTFCIKHLNGFVFCCFCNVYHMRCVLWCVNKTNILVQQVVYFKVRPLLLPKNKQHIHIHAARQLENEKKKKKQGKNPWLFDKYSKFGKFILWQHFLRKIARSGLITKGIVLVVIFIPQCLGLQLRTFVYFIIQHKSYKNMINSTERDAFIY